MERLLDQVLEPVQRGLAQVPLPDVAQLLALILPVTRVDQVQPKLLPLAVAGRGPDHLAAATAVAAIVAHGLRGVAYDAAGNAERHGGGTTAAG